METGWPKGQTPLTPNLRRRLNRGDNLIIFSDGCLSVWQSAVRSSLRTLRTMFDRQVLSRLGSVTVCSHTKYKTQIFSWSRLNLNPALDFYGTAAKDCFPSSFHNFFYKLFVLNTCCCKMLTGHKSTICGASQVSSCFFRWRDSSCPKVKLKLTELLN